MRRTLLALPLLAATLVGADAAAGPTGNRPPAQSPTPQSPAGGPLRGSAAAPPAAPAARPPAAAANLRPKWSALPAATMPPIPDAAKRPPLIPAGEKVEGIHPAEAPKEERDRFARLGAEYTGYIQVFTTAEAAAGFTEQRREALADGDACLVNALSMGEIAGAWPSRLETNTHIPKRARGGPGRSPIQTGVTAIHFERLVVEGAAARLEVRDAWVDPDSLGARLVARVTLPLAKLAGGPHGMDVYAARDGDALHAVVVPANAGPTREQRKRHLPLAASLPGGEVGISECDFLRVTLHSAPGASEMAVIRAAIQLPPLDDEPQPAGRFGILVPTTRQRPMDIHLSVSQTKAEPEPLVSLTFGWGGGERPGF